MQVSVESPSKLERRITVSVPVEEVENAFDKRIMHIAQTAELKGFRRGKAPLSYVKQRFGGEARNEALSTVIQSSLYEALKKENLHPVNTPQIEPKMLQPNQPLEYIAVFEVMPDIDAIHFTDARVEKLAVTITEADVDEAIERLRFHRVTWRKVDRSAQEKDQVIINYHTIQGDVPDLKNKVTHFELVLGSKKTLPGFEEGLFGAKAGEERTLHLQFPQDFSTKEKAGMPVDFIVQILEVKEAELPIVDDVFAQSLGITEGGVTALRDEIKINLNRERDRLAQEKLKEQLFNILLEQNPIEIPNSLVQSESKRIHDELHPHHGQEHHHSHEETQIFDNLAKKRVTLSLLITEFARKHTLTIDQARVQTRIQEIAATYEHPEEVIRWISSNKEQKSIVETRVLEEQVVEKLLEGAQIVEKTINYQELIAK